MNVNKIYSLDEKLKHYLTDFNNKKTYMTMIGLYNKTYGGGGWSLMPFCHMLVMCSNT